MRSLTETAALLLAALLSASAWAADFRSVAENGTILYDAPSAKAKRLFVVPRDYPVEVIVTVDNWVKVRDMTGDLTWLERKSLSDKRTVVVTTGVADVRQGPNEQSALSFRVQQGVALDLTELGNAGWAKVRHRDGQTGYIRINAIWGH